MRFRQFKITEAPEDNADFKAALQAFYATLVKKNPEDSFLANNARKNENMRLVAQFAQDNDLQSMLNPLTGKSYSFSERDESGGGGDPEEVNMDLPTLERMADVGGLTTGVMAKLGNEMLAAKGGKAGLGGRTWSSLFGIKDPEMADKIQTIMAKNKAAAEKPSTVASIKKPPQGDSGPEEYPEEPPQIKPAQPETPAPGDVSTTDDAGLPTPPVDAADAGTPAKTKTPAPAAKSKAPYSMGTPSGKVKIKPGDSLGAIARKYGTTVDAMMKANPNIKDANKIAAGGALKLPKGANTKRFDATVAMQKELIAQGADIKADGIMGPKTHAAIKDPKIGGKITAARQAARDAAQRQDDTGPTLGQEVPLKKDDTGSTPAQARDAFATLRARLGKPHGPDDALPDDAKSAGPDEHELNIDDWRGVSFTPPADPIIAPGALGTGAVSRASPEAKAKAKAKRDEKNAAAARQALVPPGAFPSPGDSIEPASPKAASKAQARDVDPFGGVGGPKPAAKPAATATSGKAAPPRAVDPFGGVDFGPKSVEKSKAPTKKKKPTGNPNFMVNSRSGTTRLKYLAGIKE